MQEFDFDKVKAERDAFRTRKQQLLAKSLLFRKSMCEALDSFVQRAREKGIDGISPVKLHKDTAEYFEARVQLNDYLLVIISANLALPVNIWPFLAAKIFVYKDGDDIHTPLFEISINEDVDHGYVWGMYSFGPKEPIHSVLRVDDSSGELAASVLIKMIYSRHPVWKQEPTLRSIRNSQISSEISGFRSE